MGFNDNQFDEKSTLWVPTLSKYPVTLEELYSYKFSDIIDLIKDDIVLADKVLLPGSPPLFSFQRVQMRAYRDHRFNWTQAVRGGSKTYNAARYMLVESLVNTVKWVDTGPTYRQALHYFNYVETLIGENSEPYMPINLSAELDGPILHGSMRSEINLLNGSRHVALPMGDGKKIRGERADGLGIDEAFDMEREMFQMHITPFLLGQKRPNSIGPKLIMTTSAEYEDSYAYQILTEKFLPAVAREERLSQANPQYQRKYCVMDFNVDDIRASGYELGDDVLNLLLEGASEEERQQTLYNKWVGLGGQFFSGDMIDAMRTPEVKVEFRAEPGYEYGFAVDVATAEKGDQFVIHVCKFLPPDKMAVVYSFWGQGLSGDEMAHKIHHFRDKFNPSYIFMDKGGGGLYVLQSLSHDTLELADKTKVKINRPLLMHNEAGLMDGDRIIILNRPTDPLLRAGLFDENSNMGDLLTQEDVMLHLTYDGFRQMLRRPDRKFLIPQTVGDGSDEFMSEKEVYDNIRTSAIQLRSLTIETRELGDGKKEIVKTQHSRVPKYKWKRKSKDGAVALAYAYLLYRIFYRSHDDSVGAEPIFSQTIPSESDIFGLGLPDWSEGQRMTY